MEIWPMRGKARNYLLVLICSLVLTLAWSTQASSKVTDKATGKTINQTAKQTTGKTKTRTTRTTRNFLEPYKLKDFIVKKTTVKGQMQIYYDLNKDSKIDQIETFELKTFESRQFESRRLTQKKIDRNFDGKFDYTKDVFFGRKDGLLDKSNSDTNFDGKIDKTEESYLLDRTKEMNTKKIIVYTKLDKNHDGKMNVSFSRLLNWTQHKEVLCSGGPVDELKLFLKNLSKKIDTNASEKEGNFYITDFGFKIHDDCVDKWGKSEILETVADGLHTGMQCLIELEKKYQQKVKNGPAKKEQTNNKRANVSGALRNAVAIQSLLENQPVQLICNETTHNWGLTAVARASLKNWDAVSGYEGDEIKHPFISISPQCSDLKTSNVNQVIFHEIFHSIGHLHGKSVEYAYTCSMCCFPYKHSDEAKKLACDICAMNETEASSRQYVEKIVSWSSKSLSGRFTATQTAKAYIKANPKNNDEKKWGMLQLAKASYYSPVSFELVKVLRKKSQNTPPSLSREEIKALKKEHSRFKFYQPQARVTAEAMYAFYMEADVDGALKKIEKNIDKIKAGTVPIINVHNALDLRDLLLEIAKPTGDTNYTDEQQKRALSLLDKIRDKYTQ